MDLTAMGNRRCGHVVVSNGSSIYAIGGNDAFGDKYLQTVEVYDLKANKWREGPSLPSARAWGCGASAGGSVYVFGGCDEEHRCSNSSLVHVFQ